MHLKDQFKEKIHHFFFRKQFWSSLLITIKFPISSHRYPFKIYKVISLPVPINSTSTRASQLLDTPDYLAVTSYHQKYATFLTAQLSDYTRNLPYIICSSNIPLTPVTVPNCMMALFSNYKHQTKDLCNFVPSILKSDMLELTYTSI